MKKLLIFLCCIMSITAMAQDKERKVKKLTVPLSEPGKRGKLTVELINGSITVQAYNGKDVIVNAVTMENTSQPTKTADGMYKIPNNSYGLEIQERDNHVEIETESWKKRVDFEILIPKEFDLELKTVNRGEIVVSGIHGEIEVSNVNSSITLNDIEGNVLANTVNGKILATLNKVTPDVQMSFTTLNGKIDLTLPPNVKATARIQSDFGDIYSDFNMELEEQPTKLKTSEHGNYKKLEVGKWVVGKINGGGPELRLKNTHGNIYIRQKK